MKKARFPPLWYLWWRLTSWAWQRWAHTWSWRQFMFMRRGWERLGFLWRLVRATRAGHLVHVDDGWAWIERAHDPGNGRVACPACRLATPRFKSYTVLRVP